MNILKKSYTKQLSILNILFFSLIFLSIISGIIYGCKNILIINKKIDNSSNIIQLNNSIINYQDFLIQLYDREKLSSINYALLKEHKEKYTRSLMLIHTLLIKFETFNNLSRYQEKAIIRSLYEIQTKIGAISFKTDHYIYQNITQDIGIQDFKDYLLSERKLLEKELLILAKLNQNDIKEHIQKMIFHSLIFLVIISLLGYSFFIQFKRSILNDLKSIQHHIKFNMDSNEIQTLLNAYLDKQNIIDNEKETKSKNAIILREKTKQMKQITEQLIYAQENERQNISQFIHNDIGQHLTALNLEASFLDDKVIESNDLNQMKYLIQIALKKVKAISKYIHPPQLNNQNLMTIFKSHAIEVLPKNISLDLQINNEEQLTTNQKIALYRSFQESLTNIIRHAKASEIIVSLTKSKKNYLFNVEDNGKGLNTTINSSTGLIAIKHRISHLNGTFEIKNKDDGTGTIVSILLPREL